MDCIGFIILSLSAIVLSTPYNVKGEEGQVWTCPNAWVSYNHQGTMKCFYVSNTRVQGTMQDAHKQCLKLSASLIVFDSQNKWTVGTELMSERNGQFWLGLQQIKGKTYWLTKSGSQLAKNLPTRLQKDVYWWGNDYYNHNYGQLYNPSIDRVFRQDTYSQAASAFYICEKEPDCNDGWFGLTCDKECHCHGKVCNPKDVSGTCLHGCQVGWMGNDCTQPKEDATLKYYCVNSPDLGEYLHIRVDTKGVKYDHIHAVDSHDKYMPWCNNTHISYNRDTSVETIVVYMREDSDKDMMSGNCAGHKVDNDYEWRIKIQEKEGFVSMNDQQFRLTCNTSSTFDTMTALVRAEIDYGDKDFQHLKSQEELLDLQVVDAFSGLPVTKKPIGSSVVLKIRYGLDSDDDATGVMPYSCDTSSADGSHSSKIIDVHGCPLPGSPITQFKNNGSKSLITEPFPLLSHPGSKSITFKCSYKLCFDNDDCNVDCGTTDSDHSNTGTRHKRSTERIVKPKLSGSIEVEYPHHWKGRSTPV